MLSRARASAHQIHITKFVLKLAGWLVKWPQQNFHFQAHFHLRQRAAERENAAANKMEIDLFFLVSVPLFYPANHISHTHSALWCNRNISSSGRNSDNNDSTHINYNDIAPHRKSKTHVLIYTTNAFSLSLTHSLSVIHFPLSPPALILYSHSAAA